MGEGSVQRSRVGMSLVQGQSQGEMWQVESEADLIEDRCGGMWEDAACLD